VGKTARGRSIGQISRSGLWLIGGALLFSMAVLAWAFQGDSANPTAHAVHRPAPAKRPTVRIAAAPSDPVGMEAGPRPPAVSDYETLLQNNAFQPRVVPQQNSRADAARAAEARKREAEKAKKALAARAQPDNTGDWRGWIYNGIAQINNQTYALMDQPNKKQSRFVKVGDRLEDATITQVSENQVALREQAGSVVRVERVDAMAALLRSTHPTTPAVRGAPATPTQIPGAPGVSPLAAPTPGQFSPQPSPATTAAVGGAAQGAPQDRRGRRFQQGGGFGDTGG
jgi:hypothetical protein